MSLGNDPSRVPDRQEPEPEPCRYCPGKTHDSQRVCPDCRHERGNRLVPDGGEEVGRATKQTPVIGHFFADYGTECEALSLHGTVVRFTLEPRENAYDDAVLEADLMETTPACDLDLGLFHPVCSRWAGPTSISGDPEDHENMIPRARDLAEQTCEHYIIENVPQAPLKDPVYLTGGMFGLPIEYERAFETSFDVEQPPRQSQFDPGTETSSHYFSERTQEWWQSVKGLRGDYTKQHAAKNATPIQYVDYLLRAWQKATGRAQGSADYSNYEEERRVKEAQANNEQLAAFADGGVSADE